MDVKQIKMTEKLLEHEHNLSHEEQMFLEKVLLYDPQKLTEFQSNLLITIYERIFSYGIEE